MYSETRPNAKPETVTGNPADRQKMRRLFYILIIFSSVRILGQTNLVVNASFESTYGCPINNNFPVNFYNNWQTIYDSPDYYNTCDNSFHGVPKNFWGYQPAFHGNGYAGIGTFLFGSTLQNGREYFQGQLKSKLKKDTLYCVSFYANPANDNSYYCNNLGAYFNATAFPQYTTNLLTFSLTPQISNPITNNLSDTTLWYKISGTFTSNGTEEYITIGNFTDNPNSTSGYIGGVSSATYYYIDSITVCPCTLTNINEFTNNQISIFPNPVSEFLFIKASYNPKIRNIIMYNNLGQRILITDAIENNKIDLRSVPNGLYFLEVLSESKPYYDKILIRH